MTEIFPGFIQSTSSVFAPFVDHLERRVTTETAYAWEDGDGIRVTTEAGYAWEDGDGIRVTTETGYAWSSPGEVRVTTETGYAWEIGNVPPAPPSVSVSNIRSSYATFTLGAFYDYDGDTHIHRQIRVRKKSDLSVVYTSAELAPSTTVFTLPIYTLVEKTEYLVSARDEDDYETGHWGLWGFGDNEVQFITTAYPLQVTSITDISAVLVLANDPDAIEIQYQATLNTDTNFASPFHDVLLTNDNRFIDPVTGLTVNTAYRARARWRSGPYGAWSDWTNIVTWTTAVAPPIVGSRFMTPLFGEPISGTNYCFTMYLEAGKSVTQYAISSNYGTNWTNISSECFDTTGYTDGFYIVKATLNDGKVVTHPGFRIDNADEVVWYESLKTASLANYWNPNTPVFCIKGPECIKDMIGHLYTLGGYQGEVASFGPTAPAPNWVWNNRGVSFSAELSPITDGSGFFWEATWAGEALDMSLVIQGSGTTPGADAWGIRAGIRHWFCAPIWEGQRFTGTGEGEFFISIGNVSGYDVVPAGTSFSVPIKTAIGWTALWDSPGCTVRPYKLLFDAYRPDPTGFPRRLRVFARLVYYDPYVETLASVATIDQTVDLNYDIPCGHCAMETRKTYGPGSEGSGRFFRYISIAPYYDSDPGTCTLVAVPAPKLVNCIRVLATQPCDQIGKVLVQDADLEWVELTNLDNRNWVAEFSWDESIDQPSASANIEAFLAEDETKSLSPLIEESTFNRNNAAAYAPLVQPGRGCRIIMFWPDCSEQLVFDGIIDSVNFADRLQIQARDKFSNLIDRQIEKEIAYPGGVALHQLIIDVMADNFNLDANDDDPPTLFTINGTTATPINTNDLPPGLTSAYTQKTGSLGDALKELAGTIGWDIRYFPNWEIPNSDHRLVFYEPMREKEIPDQEFSSEEYYEINDVGISRVDVRNIVDIAFYAPGTNIPIIHRKRSDASIAKYGRRYMMIECAQPSQIDTVTEAEALAKAALADLSEPWVTKNVTMPIFWQGQLGDLYVFKGNGLNYTDDQTLAPVTFRHHVRINSIRTEMELRGNIAGSYRNWIDNPDQPGIPSDVIIAEIIFTETDFVNNSFEGTVRTDPTPLSAATYDMIIERQVVCRSLLDASYNYGFANGEVISELDLSTTYDPSPITWIDYITASDPTWDVVTAMSDGFGIPVSITWTAKVTLADQPTQIKAIAAVTITSEQNQFYLAKYFESPTAGYFTNNTGTIVLYWTNSYPSLLTQIWLNETGITPPMSPFYEVAAGVATFNTGKTPGSLYTPTFAAVRHRFGNNYTPWHYFNGNP